MPTELALLIGFITGVIVGVIYMLKVKEEG